RITTSEGLTVDPNHPKTVQANAPAAIRLEFTAPGKPGPFEHEVIIESNDPSKPKLSVKLTGKVRQFIELDPPAGVDFGRRPVTFAMPRTATLLWYGDGPVRFLEATSDSPKFDATVKPIQQGPHGMVTVNAKPPFDKGEHTATITVKTDCKDQPTIEVPVKLYQPERIEAEPAVVSVTKSTRIQQVAVTILNNTLKPLTITDAKATNPSIRWQFYPEPDGITYKPHLTLPPNFAVAPEGERVTIYTTDAEYGEIVVPI